MKNKEIVQALRCCAKGLGHDDACENCKVGEIQNRREYIEFAAANAIERLTDENATLREKVPLTEDTMINLAAQALGVEPSRLRELAEADKDGRVVVLPCRQGDELWTYCNHPVKRVYSFTVSDVSTLNGRTVLNTLGLGTIRPEDIGKTVFLTREEAEKALQEMEGKA